MDIELSGANPVGNNATDLQKQRNHYGHEGCEARFPKKNYNETGFKISYRCVLTKKHGERNLFKQFKK